MEYGDDELLALSGIQHFAFCRRQWALIHIDGVWKENFLTVQGDLLHEKAHNGDIRETRKVKFVSRAMPVLSRTLGFGGQCDVVEFYADADGVCVRGREGRYSPYPVEYKRGKPKDDDTDALQLAAQAMCLEEMLSCHIFEGAVYYGEIRRRQTMEITSQLRERVADAAREMHELYRRGYVPKVKPHKGCRACSLADICMPVLSERSARRYNSGTLAGEEAR